eukprot:4906942-Amphidinium_carterae.1
MRIRAMEWVLTEHVVYPSGLLFHARTNLKALCAAALRHSVKNETAVEAKVEHLEACSGAHHKNLCSRYICHNYKTQSQEDFYKLMFNETKTRRGGYALTSGISAVDVQLIATAEKLQ